MGKRAKRSTEGADRQLKRRNENVTQKQKKNENNPSSFGKSKPEEQSVLVNDKLKIQATERNSFCLGTYNVRSWGGRLNDTSDCWVTNASNTARLATQADIDILGVQECRIPGVNRIQIVTENGPWTLLHSGHGTKKKFINGVGLLLNRRATKAMIGYHGINERIQREICLFASIENPFINKISFFLKQDEVIS